MLNLHIWDLGSLKHFLFPLRLRIYLRLSLPLREWDLFEAFSLSGTVIHPKTFSLSGTEINLKLGPAGTQASSVQLSALPTTDNAKLLNDCSPSLYLWAAWEALQLSTIVARRKIPTQRNSNHSTGGQCSALKNCSLQLTAPCHTTCWQWDASQAKGQWLPLSRGLPGNCQAVDLLPNSTLANTVLPFCTDSLIVCITSKLDIYFFPIPAFIWHDAQF